MFGFMSFVGFAKFLSIVSIIISSVPFSLSSFSRSLVICVLIYSLCPTCILSSVLFLSFFLSVPQFMYFFFFWTCPQIH